MLKHLKELCLLPGISGDEGGVREYIQNHLPADCSALTDALGNLIVEKKGQKPANFRVLLDAHMDEVGMIVSSIREDGFLSFHPVGGISSSALLSRRVLVGGRVPGVIGTVPVHLLSKEERKAPPKTDSLVIDIGAADRAEAESVVCVGDSVTFEANFTLLGEGAVCSKALDDRIGCAILLNLLQKPAEYGFTAVFSVQEEVGSRGAAVAAYRVAPDFAFCLEATTAADLHGVPAENQVCRLSGGPAVSFMDLSTLYDRELYRAALQSGIPCQPKSAVAGGNNSRSLQKAGNGVRTLALSVPCRYIHSSCCVADLNDIDNTLRLAEYLLTHVQEGDFR